MRALVVESGGARAALAAVRGLGIAGWHVGVAVPEPGLSTASRWCERWHRVPRLRDGIDGFASALEDAIVRFGYEVVLPAGDAEVLALSAARDRLSAVVPLPEHNALLRAMDKLTLTRTAERVGLSVPATWEPGKPVPPGVHGPLIVKPRLHSEPGSPVVRRPARLVPDAGSAGDAIALIEGSGGAPILQQLLAGRLIAWVGLVDRDGTVAVVQQEAQRTHPPDAGVTARGVTVAVSPELTVKVEALLAQLSWTGLAQLQFIQPDAGPPHLLDLNARCYGSLALAIGAGVNFPALLAAGATGRPLAHSEPSLGTCYQWLEGDLRSAWSERRGGLWHDLADVLRSAWGASHSVWRGDDPLPALLHGRQLAARAVDNARRGSASRGRR